MKTKLFLTTSLIALVMIPACTTTPEGKTIPDVPRIAAVTREAATIGTQQALLAHPEWATQFRKVYGQLSVLSSSPDITVEKLLVIVNQLPVKQLQSQNATLAISGARLLITATGWSSVTVVRAQQMKPVVDAIMEGMVAGGLAI